MGVTIYPYPNFIGSLAKPNDRLTTDLLSNIFKCIRDVVCNMSVILFSLSVLNKATLTQFTINIYLITT